MQVRSLSGYKMKLTILRENKTEAVITYLLEATVEFFILLYEGTCFYHILEKKRQAIFSMIKLYGLPHHVM